MGCTLGGTRPERKILNQINRKINSSVLCIDSVVSVNTNLGNLSRVSSSKAIKCLKIKIIPEDNSISCHKINLSSTQLYMASLEYTPDYNYIKKQFSAYVSALGYFSSLVHDICLSKFEMTEGIFILLVSITANKTASIKYTPNSPYIEVTGEINSESNILLQQWNNLCGIIAEVLVKDSHKIKKSMKRLEIFRKLMQEHLESSARPIKIEKNIELCNCAITTGDDLIGEATVRNESITKFFMNIQVQLKDIEKYGNLAQKAEIFTGERIVHVLLGA